MTDELHASLDWSGLEVIDLDECYELLGRSPVGRLGFIAGGEPVVLPVNYAVDGRSIVFRTGQGSKLSSAVMEQPVAFEIDSWDATDYTGWSVLVKGVAETVPDEATVERLERLPVRPWSSPDLRPDWVRIRPDEVSGRRILPIGPRR